MMADELDPVLMHKVLGAVRLESRESIVIRVSRQLRGNETDSHTFEYEAGGDLAELQKAVTATARRWGSFGVGVSYLVERIR